MELLQKLQAAMQYDVERYGIRVTSETRIGSQQRGGFPYPYMNRALKDTWYWTYKTILDANRNVQRVVDIGSGDGGHLLTALSTGVRYRANEVTLVDANEENIKQGREYLQKTTFTGAAYVHDIAERPLEAVKGQVVFMVNTLQYIDDAFRAVANAFASVETRGCLIIVVPNKVWAMEKGIDLKQADAKVVWNWAPWEFIDFIEKAMPRGGALAGTMTLWPPKSTRPAREGVEKEFHFDYSPTLSQYPEAISWALPTIAVLSKR